MLNKYRAKSVFWCMYGTLCLLQLIAASQFQLFGDEAFYWLESQYLSWSYAELPAWTQWTIAFSEWLLPQHHLTVRLPGLLAAFSFPWLGMLINRTLHHTDRLDWRIGMLMLSLPLLAVAGIMAIPDVWLVFFGLLAVWVFITAVQKQQKKWFVWLGLVLALGINVHLRFWLIPGLAGGLILWHYRHDWTTIKHFISLTLPIMMIGFLPILWFNFQHDFPLFSFQLKDRHPWAFQLSHSGFIIQQILVTTPLIFALCVWTVVRKSKTKSLVSMLCLLALLHWLVYALLGFFTDDIRLNVHWMLFSYALLLTLTATNELKANWLNLAITSGYLCTMVMLSGLVYWQLPSTPISKLNSNITENSRSWQMLANHSNQLLQTHQLSQVTTDHFMTLAELQYYAGLALPIKVLEHPMNEKHGRRAQLALMSLLAEGVQEEQLVVVEHSGMKLTEQISFYQQACQTLNGLEWIDAQDFDGGLKVYYFFRSGTGTCQIPPIYYLEQQASGFNGWVMHPRAATDVSLQFSGADSKIELTTGSLGIHPMFDAVDDRQYQLSSFSVDSVNKGRTLQLHFDFGSDLKFAQVIYTD